MIRTPNKRSPRIWKYRVRLKAKNNIGGSRSKRHVGSRNPGPSSWLQNRSISSSGQEHTLRLHVILWYYAKVIYIYMSIFYNTISSYLVFYYIIKLHRAFGIADPPIASTAGGQQAGDENLSQGRLLLGALFTQRLKSSSFLGSM